MKLILAILFAMIFIPTSYSQVSSSINVIKFPSGAWYEGAIRDGAPNGQGVYYGPDGSKYVGGFKDGLRNGFGTVYYSDGSSLYGEYLENKLNGLVTHSNKGGDVNKFIFINNSIVEKKLNTDIKKLPKSIESFLFGREHQYQSTADGVGLGYKNHRLDIGASIYLYNKNQIIPEGVDSNLFRHELQVTLDFLKAKYKEFKQEPTKNIKIFGLEAIQIDSSYLDSENNIDEIFHTTIFLVVRKNDFLKIRITFKSSVNDDEAKLSSRNFIKEVVGHVSRL
jgi:hypothetical protein